MRSLPSLSCAVLVLLAACHADDTIQDSRDDGASDNATTGATSGDAPINTVSPGRLDGGTSAPDPTGQGGPSSATASEGGTAISPRADGGAPTVVGDGFYLMEKLDRGLVAVKVDDGVFLSFRLLGHEYDPAGAGVSFTVLRDGKEITTLDGATNYLDPQGTASSHYAVRIKGAPADTSSREQTPLALGYLRIPLAPPAAGTTPASPKCETANEHYTYNANDASAADLDGDGTYELILKWDPSNSKDNSQSGCTGNVFLDAYQLDGTRLWRIDLGPNIRAGAHYTQFMAYDLDGDGRAELTLKTAPGTRDGKGSFLGTGPAKDDDDTADYRSVDNASERTGYILTGPEYLTVFDGLTGAERVSVAFDQARGKVSAWGDNYGNRVDRFLAAVAYLDDTGLPSVVMARGYYTRTTLSAWNFRDGELKRLWKFDSDQTPKDSKGHAFTDQGSHSMSVANVDDDKQHELIYGSMVVDHDGSGRCSTGFAHGDALHVSDFLPERPGLEVFMPHENKDEPSYDLHDASTCETVFVGPVTGKDTGRGVAADVTPGAGAEFWSSGGTGLLDKTGQKVGAAPSSINFLAYWDGDDLRELVDETSISKYGAGVLLQCDTCSSNNTTKSTPSLVADLFGDFREEVIWREADNSALRVYTTTVPTQRRVFTLMHDPQYRAAVAWQNVAYNQPAHPSFALASDLPAPPKPDIRYPE